MSEQISSKVTEYINSIAKSFGVTTEYVYETMGKQMILEGVIHTILYLLILTVFGFALYKLIKLIIEKEMYEDEFIVGCFFSSVIVVVIIMILIFGLSNSVMKMFNPDYYVIKEVLNIFK